ncbi:hypothetical protein SAMN04487959_10571 [Modicisalibacter xianhensis]|uniref:Uncharacterized protein n=1 Tax=Modicisalibacter xianhensis TaxID=442341 RepID=A0A1I3APD9_9GAMM|nr:hypothetical protein SAMN04487959_10571 [Halomonas xianhensis]
MLRWGQSRHAKEFINTSQKIGQVLIIKILILYFRNNAECFFRNMAMKRVCFRGWLPGLNAPLPKRRGTA